MRTTAKPTPNQALWSIAAPMLISNLSVPLLGIVDTAVLGHTDNPVDLAAVALGSAMITTLFWAFGFLRMGTTGLTAQDYGRSGTAPVLRLQQSLLIAVSAGSIVWLSSYFWLSPISELIAPEGEFSLLVFSYSEIRIWGMIPALALYAVNGWFIGIGDAKTPLKLMVLVNLINIVGDFILVAWLDFGAVGAAWATLFSEVTTALVALLLISQRGFQLFSRRHGALLNGLSQFIQANAALMVRTLILLGCILYFNARGAALGTNVAAANAVLYQLVALSAFLLDAYAHALETFVGRYIGQNDREKFLLFNRVAFRWSVGSAVVFSLAFALVGPLLIQLMTDQTETVTTAHLYLWWVVALPIASVLSYQYDGVFIGAGAFKAMCGVMIAAGVVFFAIIAATQHLGNHGLWMAFMGLNLSRSIGMWLVFKRLVLGWFYKA